MFKKIKEDSEKLWVEVCETHYPSFWGFVIGYCGTSTAIYTIICVTLIILGIKYRNTEEEA